MNHEMPPLAFRAPDVKPRRQARRGFPEAKQPTPEKRREIAKLILAERESVERAMKELSPEQRRAVILKLRHDRPLKPSDFAGTGLRPYGELGEDESLATPKEGNLMKLAQRAEDYAQGTKATLAKPGLLTALSGIEIANARERLSEEMLEQYEQLIAGEHVVFELEVTAPASTQSKRKLSETETIVKALGDSLGRGIHGHIYDTDYFGEGAVLMVGTTGKKLREWVEGPEWWQKITRFELRPQFRTIKTVIDDFNISQVSILPPPEEAPSICVIDSGVAIGNPFLGPVTRHAESKSWVYGASPVEDVHAHGSAVASLAAYHTIDLDGVNAASAWIVSARIMTDDGYPDSPRFDDPVEDRREQSWLLSKVLREIVEHCVPLGVRIFVLSFQIQGHIWSKATRRQVGRNAWLARTLDRLSREYDIVFVGITGNLMPGEIEELREESNSNYPGYLLTSLAKLLDPGPSVLTITCGSISHTEHLMGSAHGLIARMGQPSPFTRTGPGFGDCIKPDVVERGGSLVRDLNSDRIIHNLGTNVITASNRATPAIGHSHGTSLAAPRVANHLAHILSDAQALGINPGNCLLRAFLAASCSNTDDLDLPKADRLSLVGHGMPNGQNALLCQGHSALLYWEGEVDVNTTAIFRLHVPPEILQAGSAKKRITIAVASAPEVQQWGLDEYLGSKLKFRLFRGDVSIDKIIAQLQREDSEKNIAASETSAEMKSEMGISARSEGTLQRDVFPWSEHDARYSEEDYTLAVEVFGPARWLKNDKPHKVPIAVVARLEDTSGACQNLYARVQARLKARG